MFELDSEVSTHHAHGWISATGATAESVADTAVAVANDTVVKTDSARTAARFMAPLRHIQSSLSYRVINP
jgi:hypothetical protein